MADNWALKLVVKWCEDRADKLRKDANHVKYAYRKGPLPPLAGEFADLLDRQAVEWRDKALELRARKVEEVSNALENPTH